MLYEKISDLLLFRPIEDDDGDTPSMTTGSIVWGVLLRSAIIIVISFLLLDQLHLHEYWYIILFAVWFFAVYPGYQQYQKFNQKIEKMKESTLCGSCRHFDPSGQLCTILDEHVSSNYIPCEGESWEPKP